MSTLAQNIDDSSEVTEGAESLPPPPYVIDSTPSSLSLSWPSFPSATKYSIQISSTTPTEFPEADESGWYTLSSKFGGTSLKKKNLLPTSTYSFRYRPRDSLDYISLYSPPLTSLLVQSNLDASMSPKAEKTGKDGQVSVSWSEPVGEEGVTEAAKYTLSHRTDPFPFSVVGTVTGTAALKKNLSTNEKHYFRVTALSASDDVIATSGSSNGVKPGAVVSPWLTSTLPQTIHEKDPKGAIKDVTLRSALGGAKAVVFYFSASWCGPCRNFTPKLVEFYRSYGAKFGVKVVFVSCDHNDGEFGKYYGGHMPWLAVPFEDESRERLQGRYGVSGIPRAVVVGVGGRVVCDNAVGGGLGENEARMWTKG